MGRREGSGGAGGVYGVEKKVEEGRKSWSTRTFHGVDEEAKKSRKGRTLIIVFGVKENKWMKVRATHMI